MAPERRRAAFLERGEIIIRGPRRARGARRVRATAASRRRRGRAERLPQAESRSPRRRPIRRETAPRPSQPAPAVALPRSPARGRVVLAVRQTRVDEHVVEPSSPRVRLRASVERRRPRASAKGGAPRRSPPPRRAVCAPNIRAIPSLSSRVARFSRRGSLFERVLGIRIVVVRPRPGLDVAAAPPPPRRARPSSARRMSSTARQASRPRRRSTSAAA